MALHGLENEPGVNQLNFAFVEHVHAFPSACCHVGAGQQQPTVVVPHELTRHLQQHGPCVHG